MSWKMHHAWVEGARILDARLASCTQCGALRTTYDPGLAGAVRVHWTLPGFLEGHAGDRILEDPPLCIARDDKRRSGTLKGC